MTLNVVSPLMTDKQKLDWIKVVAGDLRDLPADLLALGCKAARLSCSFPGQIVPAIMAEVGPALAARRRMDAIDTRERIPAARQLEQHEPDNVRPEEIEATLRATGFASLADKLYGSKEIDQP